MEESPYFSSRPVREVKMIVSVSGITQRGGFRVICKCDICGKNYEKIYALVKIYKHQFCSLECNHKWQSKNFAGDRRFYDKHFSDAVRKKLSEGEIGSKNPNWKGGKILQRGYVSIRKREHPFSNKGYVPEHRLVMEKHLGRYLLPEEIVHHEGEKNDNRIEKLMLFKNTAEHQRYHKHQRDLKCQMNTKNIYSNTE